MCRGAGVSRRKLALEARYGVPLRFEWVTKETTSNITNLKFNVNEDSYCLESTAVLVYHF